MTKQEEGARGHIAGNATTDALLVSTSTGGGAALIVKKSGNVGIGTTSPSAKFDVNSNIIRLRTAKTPASAGDTGNAGDICWDSTYVYVCTATSTWKRAALASW